MMNFDHNSGKYLDIDGAGIYCEVTGGSHAKFSGKSGSLSNRQRQQIEDAVKFRLDV